MPREEEGEGEVGEVEGAEVEEHVVGAGAEEAEARAAEVVV